MIKKTALRINKHFYYGWIVLVTATVFALSFGGMILAGSVHQPVKK